jgi:TRAP-type C4-dicarboxylate transport system substrate-binding protein
MVAAKLFYGNVLYVMNKAKFEKLSPQDQKAVLAAGVDTARWLKPRYEKWINEQVGQAVLQGNGSARAIVGKEREQLIASVAAGWNDKMDEMCGADAAKRLRALFEKYKK